MKCRARAEILAALATGMLFQVFENGIGMKGPFLVAATLLWAGYVALRLRRDRAASLEWGLGTRGLPAATAACAAVLALGVAVILSWRILDGFQPLPPTALAIFALYPVWALIQEFVVQGLFVVNLEKLGWPRAAIVAGAALLFGLAHFPDLPLMGLCALAGVFWCAIFLRTRNLYPIALCHAWLGALAYYWILERDPWSAMVPV